MASAVVLITGANRGIGSGIIKWYLSRPNHTVIAANRDPDHPSSKALNELPRAEGTSLLVIKIDATLRDDPRKAVDTLKSKGINHVDILVANAGIRLSGPMVRELDTDEVQTHIVPNVYGFIWLFKAMYPLLKAAKAPIWVTIGSSAAFLTVMSYKLYSPSLIIVTKLIRRNMLAVHNAAYAPTKLMLHWYTKAIHIEEPWLNAFPIDPGWVRTNLGGDDAPVTVEESAEGIVKVIDVATRDTHSGKLWSYQGHEVPW
ncbi:NAD(P)-binding protein [Hypoxylon trugodes]|uniref:NAD(P)-binding protein n=1 Tax=Hypoxylon trugodes TaxID=326681 RepID=UPI0021A1954F|nr:NAD(P)-binding protein [Hypoxylon trugodes]KAI1387686.1 NAD(P)-binding protein [Hypoxylon trugodes]